MTPEQLYRKSFLEYHSPAILAGMIASGQDYGTNYHAVREAIGKAEALFDAIQEKFADRVPYNYDAIDPNHDEELLPDPDGLNHRIVLQHEEPSDRSVAAILEKAQEAGLAPASSFPKGTFCKNCGEEAWIHRSTDSRCPRHNFLSIDSIDSDWYETRFEPVPPEKEVGQ